MVDERVLVVGSANFDVLSYRFQQEFMAIVTDSRLVDDFRKRVVEVDLRRSAPCRETQGGPRDPNHQGTTRGPRPDLGTLEVGAAARASCGIGGLISNKRRPNSLGPERRGLGRRVRVPPPN